MRIFKLVSIADVFTLCNAVMGFLALVSATRGLITESIMCIMIGILFDGLDGVIARRFAKKWNLGDYLDIMCDTTSFCVAPSVLIFTIYWDKDWTYTSSYIPSEIGINLSQIILLIACCAIVVTGVLRLARFCYQSGGGSNVFIGLATPGSALILVLLCAVSFPGWTDAYNPGTMPGYVVIPTMFLLSYLMISDIRYPKMRGKFGLVAGVLVVVVISVLAFPSRNLAIIAALCIGLGYVIGGPFVLRMDTKREIEVPAVDGVMK
ncbi:MAG: CDP-alcohol phosphatidyltransferase family protein [Thermoplasmata archaeon]